MKIGAIKHGVHKEKINNFLYKIDNSLSESLDILVGPDYSLSGDLLPYKQNERTYLIIQLARLSSKKPDTLIIPGTMLWEKNKQEVALSCPIFLRGALLRDIYKETDCGESKAAERVGKSYYKGDNDTNYILFKNNIISIEICSDHGKQRIHPETKLEIILADDPKAGFYLTAINTKPSRHILVCDGYHPQIEFFELLNKNIKIIDGITKKPYLEVFETK